MKEGFWALDFRLNGARVGGRGGVTATRLANMFAILTVALRWRATATAIHRLPLTRLGDHHYLWVPRLGAGKVGRADAVALARPVARAGRIN